MKKNCILLLLLIGLFSSLFANPIIPEPKLRISELYFANDSDWVLEVFVVSTGEYENNLDRVVLETSAGLSYIKPGIEVEDDEVVLITADSLLNSLSINRNGDYVRIYENYDDVVWSDEIAFGSYQNSMCSAPKVGQSLAFEYLRQGHPEGYYEVNWLCLEDSVSLGEKPLQCMSRTMFKGYILDKNDNPVPSAEISYISSYFDLPKIISNNEGYFECSSMYATNHRADIIVDSKNQETVEFSLYLNSDSTYIFKLENYDASGIEDITQKFIYSIDCVPNPASETVCFQTSFPDTEVGNSAYIRIYDMDGKIVKMLSVDAGKIETKWDCSSEIAQGEYICGLIVEGRKVATTKLIISAK